MGFFKREPVVCPICGEAPDDPVASGHFLTHLEDRPGGRIGLMCGHADAEWAITDDFPARALDHLRRVHGVRV